MVMSALAMELIRLVKPGLPQKDSHSGSTTSYSTHLREAAGPHGDRRGSIQAEGPNPMYTRVTPLSRRDCRNEERPPWQAQMAGH